MMRINLRLKERKLQLLMLIYMLMFVPIVSFLARNVPPGVVVQGIMASICLTVVVFVLTTFMSTRGLRIFYSGLLAITLIPGAVLLGYLLFAKVLLSDGSMAALFETNISESREFIVYYMNPWVTLGIALYILVPVIFIFKMKNIACHNIREHKKTFATCIMLLFLFCAVEPFAQRIYFVDFYRVFAEYKLRTLLEERAIESRMAQPFEVAVSEVEAPQTLVVVIGESLSRSHLSLYGYERDTNPLLSARRQSLKIYTDVVAPQVHTIPVMRSILTFADETHPEYLTSRPSLFELFNRAGYDTYLISNQPFEDGSSSYEPLLRMARHTLDLSSNDEPDGTLLPALQQALDNPARKLIVLHLMGSHSVYKFRYPQSFDRFSHPAIEINTIADQHKDDVETIIDEYDNSVLYNDFMIATILDLLQKKGGKTAMIYFSDHGEEVYDFRDFAGHAYEKTSTYMCDVPFIVWTSPQFDARRSDLIYNEKAPYSTTDILYSLSDIGGLRFEGFDSSRSIFSPQFAPRKRFVGDIPYDEISFGK
ncbi:MAG: phosphoethanolamine transferase [Tannerella sp.]|jgi:heptose-I-phosphate ethanolaminephosphotransferase|nr:phosphoethanolamine transferase [Tannerella sp.]